MITCVPSRVACISIIPFSEKPGESVQVLKDKLQESLKKMDIDIGGGKNFLLVN